MALLRSASPVALDGPCIVGASWAACCCRSSARSCSNCTFSLLACSSCRNRSRSSSYKGCKIRQVQAQKHPRILSGPPGLPRARSFASPLPPPPSAAVPHGFEDPTVPNGSRVCSSGSSTCLTFTGSCEGRAGGAPTWSFTKNHHIYTFCTAPFQPRACAASSAKRCKDMF